MYLYLPVAEITIFLPYVIGVAFFVGIISGLLGIGGGFILTPFLIAFGMPPSIAVGSAGVQVFSSSYNAFYSYYKRRMIPYKSALSLSIGGLIGVLIGVLFFYYLSKLINIELFIRYSFIILLCVILFLLFPNPRKKEGLNKPAPFLYQYRQLKFGMTGFFIGIISGLLGIGGGFLIVPILIYFLKCPARIAAALSQTNIMITSFFSVMLHAILNKNLDPFLSILLVFCGTGGSYLGLVYANRFSTKISRLLFAMVIILTLLLLLYSVFQDHDTEFVVKYLK